jgi:hypothetical protein
MGTAEFVRMIKFIHVLYGRGKARSATSITALALSVKVCCLSSIHGAAVYSIAVISVDLNAEGAFRRLDRLFTLSRRTRWCWSTVGGGGSGGDEAIDGFVGVEASTSLEVFLHVRLLLAAPL